MFNFLPKDAVFYDLFEGLAQHAIQSAKHLQRMTDRFPDIESDLQKIRESERDADNLAHQALDRLDRTFITPFDREDIHTLVDGLDDIVDTVDGLAKRFKLYHIRQIDPVFTRQTQVLIDATSALSDAVHLLRKSRKLSDLSERLIEIHRLENVGDDNNHAAVTRLFAGDVETLEVMKWKELHDRIEKAIDQCEDVGNTLERIVLKNG